MSEQVQLWETYNDKGFKAKLSEFAEKDAAGNDIATSLGNRYTKGETDTLLNGKEDKIDDLATIRSNASKGATAIQGVQRNGTDLALDANSKVNVEVPVLGIQVNNADVTPDPSTKKVNLTVLDTISDGSDYPVSSKTIYTALDDIYTKAETNAAIAAAVADFGGFKVVTLGPDGKPAEQSPSTKIIYLTKDDPATKTDPYTEWICTDTTGPVWEIIGETSVDLSQYYTKTEADALLANKVTVVTGKGLSTEDYSTDEKTKLAGISAGANKVESSQTNGNIKVDGTETTVYAHPAGSENVSGLYKVATDSTGHVTSATAVVKADITDLGIPAQDTTYESKTAAQGGTDVSLVTTGEKYTWNQKYDLPVNGIPKNELAQGVQDSLDAADTALQPADIDGYWNGAVIDSGSGNVVSGVSVDSSTGRVTVTKTSIVPSDSTPLVASGNGDAGTDTEYARADHVHPAEVDIDTETFISNIMVDPQNPLLDEQGNPIVASPDVTLVSAINDTEIVARRAREDINGESLELNLTGGLITGIGGKQLASAASANNGALNITVGSSSPVTFTANQPDNSPVNLTIPVATSSTEGLMSVSDKVKLEGIAGGAEVNTIASISLNGTGLTPDANRNVEITVTSPSPSDASPEMDGTADAGVSTDYARADHVHPSDSTKADKVSGATDGNFAGLNANGNLVDSGSKAADFATAAQGALADTAYQKPSTGIPSTDLDQASQTSLGLADTAYQKPSTGIPSTDLDQASQTSLGLADTAYQKPSTGIPSTDLDQASQTSLGLADTAVQDANYVHTDNNYTAAEKDKLGNIEAGAQVNVQADWDETDSSLDSYIQNKPAIPAAQIQSDWTQADNTALDYIKNKPASVSMVAGTGISITEDQVAGTMTIASTVDTSTKADKVSGATNGNFAGLDNNGNLTDSGSKAADFATAAQGALADTAVQDASYQHTDNNYTTAEKTKLAGIETGAEVNVQANWTESDTAADSYIQNKPQNLVTDANYVHTDNNYTNADQTKLAGIETGAEANVQANWTETDSTADSYIKNKPTLATVATSGDYDDLTNKPSIPAAQVNADWNASSGVAEILHKPTLATVATSGQYSDLTGTPTLATVATTGAYSDLTGTPNLANVATSGDYSDLNNAPDLSIYAESSNLATVATSGSYNDLSSKPSIPAAANDATITIKMGGWASGVTGTDVGDFTTNQDTAEDITIPAAASASGNTAATPGVMSSADKEKLDGIESGAQVNEIETITVDSGSALPITNKNVNIDLSGKVDVVAGKGLSTNDYDATDKATVTKAAEVIPSTAAAQNQLVTAQDLASALANFGGFKVSTGTGSDNHPVEANPDTKTIYLVKDTSVPGSDKYKEWICTDTTTTPVTWELIGDTSVDLSGYVEYPASHTDTHIVTFGSGNTIADSGVTVASLQNTVDTVSIDGTSYSPTSGTTDIAIPLAANSNGSGTAGAMSGADKVKLDSIASGAQVNVKPDWNAAAGTTSEILNKPTIPSAANDGVLSITVGSTTTTFSADQSTNESVSIPVADYDDTSGSMVYTDGLMLGTDKEKLDGIEDGAQVNVKPDWNAASGADSEILNKPNIPAAANDGVLTITVGGTATTFSADQSTNASVSISVANYDDTSGSMVYTDGLMLGTDKEKLDTLEPANDATITIKMGGWATGVTGTDVGDFSTDQDTAEDIVIPAAASASGNTPATPGVMSSDDKAKLDSISSGAEVNTIASVSANNAALTPDANRNVNIPLASYDDSGSPTVYTDGLMSGQDKEKLAGVATGAQVNVIEAITIDSGSALPVSSKTVNIDLSGKVDVVSGKGLSTNDYTQADKDVVDNAADVIPSDATDQNQLVSTSTMNAAIADFGGFKVSTGTGADNHPDEANPNTRTVYLVKDTSVVGADKYNEWICTNVSGPTWEKIGDTTLDLSGYVEYPSTHVDTHIVAFGPNNTIVDTGSTVASLTNSVETVSIGSGTAISPTSGTTNIVIPLSVNSNGTGSDGAMSGADKVKLDGIATGAEVNTVNTVSIGAGSAISPASGTTNIVIPLAVNNSGTGSDGAMSGADKVKLDGIAAGAEVNVQSDWSETDTTDDAYIANKPDIIIPQDSPAALGGISAPKYLMVVTTMPAAADIDPDTIYLVQGTYIGN